MLRVPPRQQLILQVTPSRTRATISHTRPSPPPTPLSKKIIWPSNPNPQHFLSHLGRNTVSRKKASPHTCRTPPRLSPRSARTNTAGAFTQSRYRLYTTTPCPLFPQSRTNFRREETTTRRQVREVGAYQRHPQPPAALTDW